MHVGLRLLGRSRDLVSKVVSTLHGLQLPYLGWLSPMILQVDPKP